MSAEYEPGTVAVATVRGVEGVRVMRVDSKLSSAVWASAQGPGPRLHEERSVTDVRPLVVLDPEKMYEGRPSTLRHWGVLATEAGLTAIRAALHDLADQIEAQTKPPKPAEPTGLGAVVEDSSHIKWVRLSNTPGTFPWVADGRGVEGWSRIDAVRVVSEGVTA